VAVFSKYDNALINKAISPKKVRKFIGRCPEAVINYALAISNSIHSWVTASGGLLWSMV
jgi:hypothetical protein